MKVKKILENNKIEVKDLAKHMGYTYPYVWRVIDGRQVASQKFKERLFSALEKIREERERNLDNLKNDDKIIV